MTASRRDFLKQTGKAAAGIYLIRAVVNGKSYSQRLMYTK